MAIQGMVQGTGCKLFTRIIIANSKLHSIKHYKKNNYDTIDFVHNNNKKKIIVFIHIRIHGKDVFPGKPR